jgi:Flp pilus assembly secretin CpaC
LTAGGVVPCAAPEALAQEASTDSTDTLIVRGMHKQLRFEKDVARIAVGDSEVLSAEVLTSRSILLLGLETGRTSLMVWYEDETLESFVVSVQPDLDVLRRALLEIHPNIRVEMAPDRDAVILRGVVPDAEYSRAAESAASMYIEAGRSRSLAGPLVRARGEGETPMPDGLEDVRVAESSRSRAPVINLLRVESLPQTLDQRLRVAVQETGGDDVSVRRLVRGDTLDDELDVFVLEGSVPDQITLTRVLFVARTLVAGDLGDSLADDVEIEADESGGLYGEDDRSTDDSSSRSSSSISGTGTSGDLSNAIEANVGRAKALSVAGGRVLSFIEVRDLPQVRVDVRIYEVNRTKLLEYAPEFTVIASDFDQGALNPATGARNVQGLEAARVGGVGTEDVQGVLSFLAEGTTAEIQVSGSNYAIDATLQILESRGLARGLANPSLTVLSGENANFQVGGQIPVPQSFAPGGVENPEGVFSAVEFRNFGIELAVRPLVGSDGALTIDVFSQVDRPSAELTTLVRDTTGADQETTSFESRTLETSARLDDGQSLVMAGLISRTDSASASYTPGLESVPIIGWLFKRFSIEEEVREIVVVINPVIVRDPVDGLATWEFPNLSSHLRDYIDEVLEYNGVEIKRYEEDSEDDGGNEAAEDSENGENGEDAG